MSERIVIDGSKYQYSEWKCKRGTKNEKVEIMFRIVVINEIIFMRLCLFFVEKTEMSI